MNNVSLTGRLVRDPEIKSTQSGVNVASFTIAVDRPYQKGKDKEADFIGCTAWRGTADFIGKYFHKGDPIEIVGSLRTRTYDDKSGVKHYVTEVLVNNVSFTQSKRNGIEAGTENANETNDYSALGDLSDFEEILSDGDTPF